MVMVRVFLGAVLLYSGLIHMWQPFYFAKSIAAYQVLPEWAISLVVVTLPALQIVLGAAFVMQFGGRVVPWLAAALFTGFLLFQFKVWVLGEQISCGCFGFHSDEIGLATMMVPGSCLLFSLLCLRFTRDDEWASVRLAENIS